MPIIICPRCRTANRPRGLSALTCEGCQRSIDPRERNDSVRAFIRSQRKLRRKSAIALSQDETDELLEWVLDLPPLEMQNDGDPGARGPSLWKRFDPLRGMRRWRVAMARRQESLYTDSILRMQDDRIVINLYYWPLGRKRIPYNEIRSFTPRPLGPWRGQFRVHGIDHRGRWYSRDRHRGEKERAIDLTVGRLIHPVLTPDDVEAVLTILERKVTNEPG